MIITISLQVFETPSQQVDIRAELRQLILLATVEALKDTRHAERTAVPGPWH